MIQFARLSGFSPIITTASPHNAPLLKELGATHVLDRKLPSEQLVAEATKIAGGPFEYVYDAIATKDTLAIAYEATARGGHLAVVLSNPEIEQKAKEDGKDVFYVRGVFSMPTNQDFGRSVLDALPRLLENGDIKVSHRSVCEPHYGTYAFSDAAKPRRGSPRWPEWGRRGLGALEEQPSQWSKVGHPSSRNRVKTFLLESIVFCSYPRITFAITYI